MRLIFALTLLFSLAASATSPPCETVACELRRITPRLQRCYKEALVRDSPTFAGKGKLTLEVRETGDVEEVTVDVPNASPLFAKCLRDAARRMHLRAEPFRSTVVLPIVFQPN